MIYEVPRIGLLLIKHKMKQRKAISKTHKSNTIYTMSRIFDHTGSLHQRSFVDFSWRRTTEEDCRCGLKFWTLCIFYWIKVCMKLPYAASFSVLCIYIHIYIYIYIYKTQNETAIVNFIDTLIHIYIYIMCIWWTRHRISVCSTCWLC